MCDVEDKAEMKPRTRPQPLDPKNCVKCKEAVASVLIRNNKYCKNCFRYAVEGKFRSILNRANATNDKNMRNILIGFSGGASSRALLNLLHRYTSAHNKYGNLKVCYIDETSVTKNKQSYKEEIIKIVEEYPYEFITCKIEDAFSEGLEPGSPESLEKLDSALNSLANLSAKEDLIENLRHSLLVHLARKTKSSILLLGESSTRIAIKTISLTSKGRGFSLPFEVAAEATCYEGLAIIRPLRDCLAKEIGIYNQYLGLRHPTIPSLSTKLPPKASITRLSEEFIIGLDSGFPSTVSTVVRTANKLTPSSLIHSDIWCPLCLNPAEVNISDWKSNSALRSLPSKTFQSYNKPVSDNFSELLCYGCRTNWEESKGDQPVPPPYAELASLTLNQNRHRLKSKIQEFLIED